MKLNTLNVFMSVSHHTRSKTISPCRIQSHTLSPVEHYKYLGITDNVTYKDICLLPVKLTRLKGPQHVQLWETAFLHWYNLNLIAVWNPHLLNGKNYIRESTETWWLICERRVCKWCGDAKWVWNGNHSNHILNSMLWCHVHVLLFMALFYVL